MASSDGGGVSSEQAGRSRLTGVWGRAPQRPRGKCSAEGPRTEPGRLRLHFHNRSENAVSRWRKWD